MASSLTALLDESSWATHATNQVASFCQAQAMTHPQLHTLQRYVHLYRLPQKSVPSRVVTCVVQPFTALGSTNHYAPSVVWTLTGSSSADKSAFSR